MSRLGFAASATLYGGGRHYRPTSRAAGSGFEIGGVGPALLAADPQVEGLRRAPVGLRQRWRGGMAILGCSAGDCTC
jgi:hypothetical protein